MRLIVESGLSGAGKGVAINALEDLGYWCVDNLPLRLLPALAAEALADGARGDRVGAVVDALGGAVPILVGEFGINLDGVRAARAITWLETFREAAEVRRLDGSDAAEGEPLFAAQSRLMA